MRNTSIMKNRTHTTILLGLVLCHWPGSLKAEEATTTTQRRKGVGSRFQKRLATLFFLAALPLSFPLALTSFSFSR